VEGKRERRIRRMKGEGERGIKRREGVEWCRDKRWCRGRERQQ